MDMIKMAANDSNDRNLQKTVIKLSLAAGETEEFEMSTTVGGLEGDIPQLDGDQHQPGEVQAGEESVRGGGGEGGHLCQDIRRLSRHGSLLWREM